jgi:hypothetical protein
MGKVSLGEGCDALKRKISQFERERSSLNRKYGDEKYPYNFDSESAWWREFQTWMTLRESLDGGK